MSFKNEGDVIHENDAPKFQPFGDELIVDQANNC